MPATSPDPVLVIQSGTHARVDLGRYEENIRILRRVAGADKTFMAVLKANAYGHGAVACGGAAVRAGAGYLAVARINEGLQLRRAGLDIPVLILGGPNPAQVKDAVNHGLTVSVGTHEALDAVQQAALTASSRPRVHLKIDSGLHRYGALPDLALQLATRCAEDDRVELEGLYGHFSSADEATTEVTDEQIARSERLVAQLESLGITFKYIHLPNSAAIITRRMGSSNLVRAGIATYGLAPGPDVDLPPGIAPVLGLRSNLTRSFQLPGGEGVSYGLTYRAKTEEWSATVPVGYADGLPRSLSNRGWFVVDGERCPIRGRVSMDQTVVGLTRSADMGAEVIIVGDSADGAMTVDDLAIIDGTINYEIATRVTARVPRVYYRAGAAIGWDDALLGEPSGT